MIGLIPCAGRAERLHGLPKYLLPLPDGYLLKNVAEGMGALFHTVVVLSKSNEVVIHGFPAITWLNPLVLPDPTRSMVHTLLEAHKVVANRNILMAMPDTYWTPQPDLFPHMERMLDVSDIVLAVWPIRDSQRGKLGTVDLDGVDVRGIIDKDPFSPHPFIWGAMAWRSSFWTYMKPEHQHLGLAVNDAIADGLRARVVFAEGQYYDCGTFEGYAELVRALTEERLNA